jgi:hypothetical protein
MNLKRSIAAALSMLLLTGAVLAQSARPFEPDSLEQIVARHQGKPFLLLVWSMDCEFCQASLDTLAKARAANPSLDIVTVSTDPASDRVLSAQIHARLSSLALADERWSFGSASSERLRFAIDPRWHGEKPRSYWYDANGLRKAYSGLIRPERLEEWQRNVARP